MEQRDRVRRTAILCRHLMANIAYYRAGWKRTTPRQEGQFWVRLNGNFLDLAVLDWCKLFGERMGKHRWERVVMDGPAFFAALLTRLKMDADQYHAYGQIVRTYRNKFVAHLDEERVMILPHLRICRTSAGFLHDHLIASDQKRQCFYHDRRLAADWYSILARESKYAYSRIVAD